MNVTRDENETMQQDYSGSSLDFASPDMFGSKFDMSNSRTSDIDYYAFEGASHLAGSDALSAYDMPLSPTMSGNEMFYNNNNGQMHADPLAIWHGAERANMSASVDALASQTVPGMSKVLTDYPGPTNRLFGQITPPSEYDSNAMKPAGKRNDSGTGQNTANISSRSSSNDFHPAKATASSSSDRPSKRARKDSQVSEGDHRMIEGLEGLEGGKREKYREKNRVAAAKCRAKKKTHVDHLEDTHRTQSMLNTALKQTEKSLRDELSFWRTQALQHTFCNCQSIQEYNLRKAQNLAAESVFGNHISNRSPSLKSMSSASAISPVVQPCAIQPSRKESLADVELGSTSPALSTTSVDKKIALGVASAHQSTHRSSSQQSAQSQMRGPGMSGNAEQELKNFIHDTAE